MNRNLALRLILSMLFFTPLANVSGEDLLIRTPSGKTMSIQVEPTDRFVDVMNHIQTEMHVMEQNEGQNDPLASLEEGFDSQSFILDFMDPFSRKASPARDYNHPLTPGERNEITYIVRTLAKSSWTQLLIAKSDLKKAGDRVAHVHPLRFVECIFVSEELKGGIHSIRDRKKVWSGFFDGLSESLSEETKRGNMKQESINDFARIVGINPNIITPALRNQQWVEFVDLLLKHIPRTGDRGRYDM